MIISLIVALDEQGGIGRNNQLLCHLPADLAYFKAQTMGKPIIMGRHTFESIGRALPGRQNIVLSSQSTMIPGVDIAHTLTQALTLCQDALEVMIIGGAKVYEQCMPIANRLYVTKMHHSFEADVHFPTIDPRIWVPSVIQQRDKDEKNAYKITFYRYERKDFIIDP